MKITPPISTITCGFVFSTCRGSIQKEAYMLGVPCVTMRENTEWVETVEDRWNVLLGADKGRILRAVDGFECRGVQRDVFGGDASGRIVRVLGEVI